MIEQYPHTIVITVRPDVIQDPVSGSFSRVTGSDVVYTLECRAETNSRNGKIVGRDGASVDYSFTVYMPQMDTVIPWESDCVLTIGTQSINGKVKGASNGQMNSRIWL